MEVLGILIMFSACIVTVGVIVSTRMICDTINYSVNKWYQVHVKHIGLHEDTIR
jgi:hypothetical protein